MNSTYLLNHEIRRRLEDEHEKHVCCGVIYPYNDNRDEALIAFSNAKDMYVFMDSKKYPTRIYSEEKQKHSLSNPENAGHQAKSASGHNTLEVDEYIFEYLSKVYYRALDHLKSKYKLMIKTTKSIDQQKTFLEINGYGIDQPTAEAVEEIVDLYQNVATNVHQLKTLIPDEARAMDPVLLDTLLNITEQHFPSVVIRKLPPHIIFTGNYKDVHKAQDELSKDLHSKTKSNTSNEDTASFSKLHQKSGYVKDSRQSNTEVLQASKFHSEFVMEIFKDELEQLKKEHHFYITVKNVPDQINTVHIMLHPNDKKTVLFNEAMEEFTNFFQSKNKNIRHSMVKITKDVSARQLDDAISTAKKTYPKMLFQIDESLNEVTIVGYVAKVAGDEDQVEKARDLLCKTLIGVSHVSSSTRNNPNAHVTMDSGTTSIANPIQENNQDTCPICMDNFTNKTSLKRCKHSFCKECIGQAMKSKSVCPICQTVYGKLEGDQPQDASMKVTTSYYTPLPGYEKYGTITIQYDVPSGRQGPEHPHPGKPYHGTTRTAYLPDSPEGRDVLSLLRRAFDQRLIFTIGTSSTTGLQDCVTWNDIHHKTTTHGGPDSYGYPDRDYLKRVQEELKAKGIF